MTIRSMAYPCLICVMVKTIMCCCKTRTRKRIQKHSDFLKMKIVTFQPASYDLDKLASPVTASEARMKCNQSAKSHSLGDFCHNIILRVSVNFTVHDWQILRVTISESGKRQRPEHVWKVDNWRNEGHQNRVQNLEMVPALKTCRKYCT